VLTLNRLLSILLTATFGLSTLSSDYAECC